MAFTLPPLPYAYDALAPHMSKETLEFHHDKHHKAYLDAMTPMIEGTEYASMPIEEIVKKSYSDNPKLFNQAGQYYNHVHFWKWMKPNGGGRKLPGKLEAQINSDLGSFDEFRTKFIDAGKTQFGSGWAWLALKGGKLVVHEHAERREPARAWRQAAARRRRVGALLLHRLPQSPAEIPGDLVRQPRQLGPRRRDVRARLSEHWPEREAPARPGLSHRAATGRQTIRPGSMAMDWISLTQRRHSYSVTKQPSAKSGRRSSKKSL